MESMTLLELSQRVSALVQRPETQNIWITAELSDVAVRGGHCYMELLQKDARGLQVAKARGVIWASHYGRIDAEFFAATGQRFASGLKVMLRVSASMHPVYGFSLVVSAVNPDFTMGDLLRRRREILQQLQREGLLDLNKQLAWPTVPQRIAVVSAKGAAGYGDFMNQLYNNPSRIRFVTELYPAVMQGQSAPASIIAALERVAQDAEAKGWDGVVIIRGGGATSDLQAFEDYDLAANVAQFPLPVAIGIGHERDVTVLDWVANTRLKTPTAVAEWLVGVGEMTLNAVSNLGNRIVQTATERMSGCREQLAYCEGLLPVTARNMLERAQSRLQKALTAVSAIGISAVSPQRTRLHMILSSLSDAISHRLDSARKQIDSTHNLVEALSPQATLRRGYTVTRYNGKAVKSVSDVKSGDNLETVTADGTVASVAVSFT